MLFDDTGCQDGLTLEVEPTEEEIRQAKVMVELSVLVFETIRNMPGNRIHEIEKETAALEEVPPEQIQAREASARREPGAGLERDDGRPDRALQPQLELDLR